MLRIKRDEVGPHEVTLLLEGRIAAAWAALLERECVDLTRSGSHVDLDVSGVVFIARSGFEALSRLTKAGVGITGCSPLIAAMLAQEGIAAACTPTDSEYR